MAVILALAVGGTARAADPSVKVAKNDKLGSFLTDAKGMTLYTFKKDTPGKSACTGDCVAKWPVFSEEKVTVSGDLKSDDFGAITRDDGKKQTTYKGLPLYFFAGDKKPSDTNGHGVREVWSVAAP
jgi:predicted lipoprotein with Yx(FWY)xxD motif